MSAHPHSAAHDTFIRAVLLGYSSAAARQFARIARRDIRPGECSRAAALRIVPPRLATLGQLTECAARAPHAPTPPGATP